MDVAILVISLCLQLLAAALAIALIPVTRATWAWILVAGALALMTGRRAITLSAVMAGRRDADLSAELVALTISVAMVLGVALIRPVFKRMRDLADDLADRERRLRRDLEDRERLEAALVESKKMEAIGRLAGGIAHDFNNMLTVIVTSTEIARLKLRRKEDPTPELADIDETAERAARLTSQLMAYARSQPVSPTAFDLNALISGMGELLHRLVRENVRLEVKLHGTPVPVMADEGQVSQVVMNLVVNACDAMPEGGALTIATDREPDGDAEHPMGVLRVSDDGPGITPEARERIFEPFFTTKPAGEGTGLGLSSSYGIVARAGGRIDVDSVVGEGTTFHVRLPGAAEAAEAPKPTRVATGRGGDERIVLVEDEPQLARLSSLALRELGYDVHHAEAGDVALEYLQEASQPPDLMITDVVMPRMGGPELARRARELHPTLPILFITGYGEHKIADLGEAEPPQVLRKPFTPAELSARVRQILDAD